MLHADIDAGGAPAGFTELHRGAEGDPRGSAQNNLVLEFLGDYVYAAATNDYGAAVWNDIRDGSTAQRSTRGGPAVQAGSPIAHPEPQNDCAATFGNSDIFGGSFPDPTP